MENWIIRLVPCSQCNICHLWILADNIINFLIFKMALPILVLAILIGGFFWMTSAGNPERIKKGKNILTSSIVGIFIAFGGWLIVDTIIKTFADTDRAFVGAWNEIKECPAPIVTAPPVVKPPVTGTPPTQNKCKDCANLSVPAKPGSCSKSGEGQTCQVNTVLNDRLVALNQKIINDGKLGYWHVTESWPPTQTHQDPCHQGGTCVDGNLLGSAKGNAKDIKYFVETAKNQGLKAVYEVSDQKRADALITSGVPKDNVLVLKPNQITGEHFSIYLK